MEEGELDTIVTVEEVDALLKNAILEEKYFFEFTLKLIQKLVSFTYLFVLYRLVVQNVIFRMLLFLKDQLIN